MSLRCFMGKTTLLNTIFAGDPGVTWLNGDSTKIF
jgi:hypothetical protein